jgi:hypothetical protein
VKKKAFVANEVVGMRALNSFKNFLQHDSSNLASLTLIMLISEMLQFSIFSFLLQEQNFWRKILKSQEYSISQSENCKTNYNSTGHV